MKSLKKRLAWLIMMALFVTSVLPASAMVAAQKVSDVTAETTVIDVTDYGADPSGKNDSVIAVQKALEAAQDAEGPVVLNFPKGEYHFWPDDATVRRIYISNSTHTNYATNSIRTIGILMENLENLTLEGNDSKFMFHGKMMSFVTIDVKMLQFRI